VSAPADSHHPRFFDANRKQWFVRVTQGNYYITSEDDVVLDTVLGSCIAACIRDPVLGIGGMNHFLLPNAENIDLSTGDAGAEALALRYGNYAMELLVNDLLKRGAKRSRLEIKLFGGANVVRGIRGIGHGNADFVERYVQAEGLNVIARHLRGFEARKVHYMPKTGRARMMLIADGRQEVVFKQEVARAVRVETTKGGDVELFD
jgi:chemotaxis protein CheD